MERKKRLRNLTLIRKDRQENEKRSKDVLQRGKRLTKLVQIRQNGETYEKRKMTTERVCHFVLFPVVFSTIGKPNDFFYRVLSLCWNDKNILKDTRYQQLLRGLRLEEKVETANLVRSEETGWFTSSRNNDLEKIGKVAGYFLRMFASSVAKALDENFTPESYKDIVDKDFNEVTNLLKERKTIVPVIVKLQISPESAFDKSRFITLSDKHVANLINGEELLVTRHATICKINEEFYQWAWQLLSSSSDASKQLLNETPTLGKDKLEPPLPVGIRKASTRLKCPNNKYSSETYEMY